jgi:hypothetical protein
VGQPRSSVADTAPSRADREPQAVRRGSLGDPAGVDSTRLIPGTRPAPSEQRDVIGSRAVPRENPAYAPPASLPANGAFRERGIRVNPRIEEGAPNYGPGPYGRRMPDQADPGSMARPANRPYGSAVPRAPQSAPPAAADAPVYGVTPRMTPNAPGPSATAPRSYGGAIERRSPGSNRPAGPPPAAAPPPSRSQPGASAPPPEQQSGPSQARPRGGAQSSGTAVPRGRGR